MDRIRNLSQQLHPYAICAVWGPLIVTQLVLAFVLPPAGNPVLRWTGMVVWCTSAFFGWAPMLILRRRGGVPKGKSYVHTTQLVDSGLYAVVRHPQMGTAGLLLSLGLMLFTGHWVSLALGLPAMVLLYLDLFLADQRLIGKFGDPYRAYMQRVPRVNFVAGLVRLARARLAGQR
jgi:protein-S-isoprenylcysteine O-methyltransferase Ste14